MECNSLIKYSKDLVVKSADIDLLGHVNNVVYLQWVQDIASEHWYASATIEQKVNYLWVAAKHEIEYLRPTFEWEVLSINTWVGKATNKFFTRHTEIIRVGDKKIVAKALTHWALIDFNTKKPVKADESIREMFSV